MRVEANISVSKTDTLGTKVEVKNLNSFKSVEGAIDYEEKRQIEELEKGGEIIQETRGWDENRSKTFTQRIKESADDYRYFPDPDLPSLDISTISDWSLSRLSENMPELPAQKRERYADLGLPSEQVEILITDSRLSEFFNSLLTHSDDLKFLKTSSNYLTSDVISLLSDEKTLNTTTAEKFAALMTMIVDNKLNSRVAKDLLPEVLFDDLDPEEAAKKRGLIQDSSEDSLLPIVETILSENASVVEEYKSGKEASLQYLVGQGMKATQGSANPGVLAELLKKTIAGDD